MGDKSKIEWTDASWNFLRGCSHVSPGCDNCYAEKMASRFSGDGQAYDGLTNNGKWTGGVRLIGDKLEQPLRWKKPRMIFVNSMSDTFHAVVPDHYINRAFDVMMEATQHTFQVLTKRPERMKNFLTNIYTEHAGDVWPHRFPHVWIGASVEDQKAADERIPYLLNTPANIRFLSCEPLLGGIRPILKMDARGLDMTSLPGLWDEDNDKAIHWIIVGAESGPMARPMSEDWVRELRDMSFSNDVAFFYKQRLVDGKKITMPMLDGTIHQSMPIRHKR